MSNHKHRHLEIIKRSASAGQWLAGAWRMALWLVRADEDFRREILGSPNIASATPCGNCPCNCSTIPWFDFAPEAQWINRTYSIEQWKASGYNHNALYDIEGVSNHSTVCPLSVDMFVSRSMCLYMS